jgi:hypothetical protein
MSDLARPQAQVILNQNISILYHFELPFLGLCKQFDPKFSRLSPLAAKLTPFSVLYRYPDVEIYPKKQTVSTAIGDAEKIFCFVAERIELERENSSSQ